MTVALGFTKDVRAALPAGFGFLVPRSEGKRMLAATFVHNKFPYRAPEDRALIRCFLGGTRDEAVLQLPDDEVLGIVRDELGQILGLNAEPLFTRIYRWQGAMAQYVVGHLDRLQRIEGMLKQWPGLVLAYPIACARVRQQCNRCWLQSRVLAAPALLNSLRP
jgi:oxygen-dependent protoporphyrinogen oxidase